MEAPVVSGKPWIDDCWWRGSKNLYLSVWEPPIMYVVWKILGALGRYVDNESIPLKIIVISVFASSSGTSANPCFPLRRAYLFTFIAPVREHHCHLYALLLIDIEYDCDWISFTMNYNV